MRRRFAVGYGGQTTMNSTRTDSVNTGSRPQMVARRLLAAIQRGTFKAGAPMPSERVLAERWGFSRPAIREGISMLVAKGTLTRRQGVGTFLNDASEQRSVEIWADMALQHPDLQGDLIEFRHMLECRAAELAAQRHDAQDRVRLEQTAAAVDQAWKTGGRKEQLLTDVAFHHAIAEATHNPVFSYLMSSLHTLLLSHMQLTAAGTQIKTREAEQVRHQHQMLLKAILSRNPKAASTAAAGHLDYVRVHLNHL